MKYLILGAGGREHAIVTALAECCPQVELFFAPGNAGTSLLGTNVHLKVIDFKGIADFCLKNEITRIIPGPEDPLVVGIYDYFISRKNLEHIKIVGPSHKGAQLEGSKLEAKKFMLRHGIPTAKFEMFTLKTLAAGLAYLDEIHETPGLYVLKADGLAGGKGVRILSDTNEAKIALQEMLEGQFGDASRTVLIEQYLQGTECSCFVLTDGKTYKVLPYAKDYKRRFAGDKGLNTGGMGAVSFSGIVDDSFAKKVEERIIKPTIEGLKKDNIVYRGFAFIGIMNVDGDPYVIEYNVRMGDPETEVVFPRIKNNFLELFEAVISQTLEDITLEIDPRSAATVVLVSEPYPGSPLKGVLITGLEKVKGSIVYHMGTSLDEANVLKVSGGRVIAVTTLAGSIDEALHVSYKNAALIDFEGKDCRLDIGYEYVQVADAMDFPLTPIS